MSALVHGLIACALIAAIPVAGLAWATRYDRGVEGGGERG